MFQFIFFYFSGFSTVLEEALFGNRSDECWLVADFDRCCKNCLKNIYNVIPLSYVGFLNRLCPIQIAHVFCAMQVYAFVAPKIIGGKNAPSPVGELGMVEMTQALDLIDVCYEQVN